MTANKPRTRLISTFKQSAVFYLKNIFSFIILAAWSVVPFSILLVIIFYLGLTQRQVTFLSNLLSSWIYCLLLFWLHFTLIKWCEVKWRDEKPQVLTAYAQGLTEILTFSWRFSIPFILFYLFVVVLPFLGGPVLYNIPLAAALLYYYLSPSRLNPSKREFAAFAAILIFFMSGIASLVDPFSEWAYSDMLFLGDVLPAVFHVMVFNLGMVILGFFPAVVFFILANNLKRQEA